MNKKLGLIFFVFFIIIAAGFFLLQANNSTTSNESFGTKNSMQGSPESDAMKKVVDENIMMEMKKMTYMYEGVLTDVTKGEVRGINTNTQTSGTAKADFTDGKYMMLATFSNLPDPINNDFYEGWIVQKSPFKFISTGKLEKVDGVYTNVYSSSDDLTPYSRYVLTIEPNDGDSSPADHIVEGDMLKQ